MAFKMTRNSTRYCAKTESLKEDELMPTSFEDKGKGLNVLSVLECLECWEDVIPIANM